MDDEVEDPMAEDAEAEDDRAAAVFFYYIINHSEEEAPDEAHEEAVRDRIGDEVEGEFRVDGPQSYFFDIKEQ